MVNIGLFVAFETETHHNLTSDLLARACRHLFVIEQPLMIQNRNFFSCRWSQGLLFHQAMVDCARAAILMPLGTSILYCRPVNKCSLVETAFLLLVTVSTVNLLTTVLNDSPVLPGDVL